MDIEITVAEAADRLARGERLRWLDVRESWEYELVHLPDAALLPLGLLPERLAELAQTPEAEIICYCHSGMRSLTAADWLRRAGVARARSLAGGIDQWAREIDPSLPRY
ncbi:MAG TPA: rhodanese-like domain-containing protein [Terriglobales bacterium]|nr:rhodanese-like domain-containing protein [Terriglobales bacterium]